MKPSIKQISELTGFSPATISNALNHKKGVNKETAEQIQKAARECGYLTESRINKIRFVIYKDSGLIVSDTPFFSSLIQGVEKESRESGYETVITNLDKASPDYGEKLRQLLNDGGSAILLLATELTEEDAQVFAEAASPIVVLDNWFEKTEFDSVLISNTDSACKAVEYLIRKGHRKIGYLKSSMRIKNFFYREAGYERALAQQGIPIVREYAYSLTPTMEGACEDMERLLESRPELPTAFFADNDIIALGAMNALRKYGIRVPEDVSMIGFDDLPFCTISSPALSTIRVFKQEMGQTAVRRLVELIRSDSRVKTKIQVCNEFVERDSVKQL